MQASGSWGCPCSVGGVVQQMAWQPSRMQLLDACHPCCITAAAAVSACMPADAPDSDLKYMHHGNSLLACCRQGQGMQLQACTPTSQQGCTRLPRQGVTAGLSTSGA